MLDITYIEEPPKEAPIASATIKSYCDKDWVGSIEVERENGGPYELSITVSTDIDSATYFLDGTAAKNLVDVINNIVETES